MELRTFGTKQSIIYVASTVFQEKTLISSSKSVNGGSITGPLLSSLRRS